MVILNVLVCFSNHSHYSSNNNETAYYALLISIFSLFIAGFVAYYNYSMRKKDFQTLLFNKQFEGNIELMKNIEVNYMKLVKLYKKAAVEDKIDWDKFFGNSRLK